MKEGRVINDEICYPAKQCLKVYELFQSRFKMYKNIYLNCVTQGIEIMIIEALMEANSEFKFDEIIFNSDSYVSLTDRIFQEIENSKSKVNLYIFFFFI